MRQMKNGIDTHRLAHALKVISLITVQ